MENEITVDAIENEQDFMRSMGQLEIFMNRTLPPKIKACESRCFVAANSIGGEAALKAANAELQALQAQQFRAEELRRQKVAFFKAPPIR